MTKADIVARMAVAAGWPKAGSERALRAALAGIRASLKRGDAVTLVGFGTFSVARRKPRTVKNPRIIEPVIRLRARENFITNEVDSPGAYVVKCKLSDAAL